MLVSAPEELGRVLTLHDVGAVKPRDDEIGVTITSLTVVEDMYVGS